MEASASRCLASMLVGGALGTVRSKSAKQHGSLLGQGILGEGREGLKLGSVEGGEEGISCSGGVTKCSLTSKRPPAASSPHRIQCHSMGPVRFGLSVV